MGTTIFWTRDQFIFSVYWVMLNASRFTVETGQLIFSEWFMWWVVGPFISRQKIIFTQVLNTNQNKTNIQLEYIVFCLQTVWLTNVTFKYQRKYRHLKCMLVCKRRLPHVVTIGCKSLGLQIQQITFQTRTLRGYFTNRHEVGGSNLKSLLQMYYSIDRLNGQHGLHIVAKA